MSNYLITVMVLNILRENTANIQQHFFSSPNKQDWHLLKILKPF